MSVLWLAPTAWIGLMLLAFPIAIHLLARRRSRRMPFPSLKFLPASQLAALRRPAVADWPLLMLRMAIVASSVAAAAAPVFVSHLRRENWNARIARAIVVNAGNTAVNAVAEDESRSSFVSARFFQPRLADALRAAAAWLDRQPPAAREVVIIGDLRERALTRSDLEPLAPQVGVRFLPIVAPDATQEVELYGVADAGGTVGRNRLWVAPLLTGTSVRYEVDSSTDDLPVRLRAAAAEQGYAEAVLRAVLRNGLVIDRTVDRRVTITFDGAQGVNVSDLHAHGIPWMQQVLEQNHDVRGGEQDGGLVVRAAMSVTDARAAHVIARVLQSAFVTDLDQYEPRRLSAATLAQWSRPSQGSPAHALPADEGDRRWLWGVALALLGVEHLTRRREPRV